MATIRVIFSPQHDVAERGVQGCGMGGRTMRRGGAMERMRDGVILLLVLAPGVLLLCEGWIVFWSIYLLLRPQPGESAPLFSIDLLFQACWGLLLLTAAYLCFSQHRECAEKCLVPAVGLILYGVWTAHDHPGWAISWDVVRAGELGTLNYLGALGFIVGGGMMLVARSLERSGRFKGF